MINWLRGYYRLCLSGLVLGLGGTLLVISSWLPVNVKGYPISMWLLLAIVRTLLFILNVKVACDDPTKIRQHAGFVFPNHVSYLDILVLVSITPLRFLAKQEVRSMPVVGQVASAIGCVFVNRDDKKSRAAARSALAQVETFPPITLFPEGKRSPGDHLLPFRYGAFDIVIQGGIPFLSCAIQYEPLDIAIWHRGESIIKAVLRLAAYGKPVQARLNPMAVTTPTNGDDPVAMSLAAHEAMTAVLFPTINDQQLIENSQ